MAHKKKIIKCFVCSAEWSPSEDEAQASTLKCPHCGMNDFAGNFIKKEIEDHSESKLFKPQWNQTAEATSGSDSNLSPSIGFEPKAKSGGHKSEHGGSARQTSTTHTESSSSGGSGGTYTSGGGTSSGHSSTGSKGPVKSSPKSVTQELTSGCFIVTATYGTGSYDRISVFYRFRDEFLLKSMPGRYFTQAYYKISPYPAAAIRRSKTLKAASRSFLDALAPIIRRLL